MAVDFQENLNTKKLKELHNYNDYADLFTDCRTVVFSLPLPANVNSLDQIKRYQQALPDLTQVGVDNVCVVSNTTFLIPYVDIHGPELIPIVDRNSQFTLRIKNHVGTSQDINKLTRFWQYVAVLENNQIVKVYNNPLPMDFSFKNYCKPSWQYFRLGPDRILKYLTKS